MARVEAYPCRRYDPASGKMLEDQRLSTREYIRERGGVAIEGGMRLVDDSLVDHQGCLVLETPGNVNRKPLTELVDAGLVTRTVVGPSQVDYGITEFGRLFVRALLR